MTNAELERRFPRPTTEQFAEFDANKDRRRMDWIINRFQNIYGDVTRGMNDSAREMWALAMQNAGEEDPYVFFAELIRRISPDALMNFYKQVIGVAATSLSWSQIEAEYRKDPVIGWGLARTKMRLTDTRPIELPWWETWLGTFGRVNQAVVEVYRGAANTVRQALTETAEIAGETAGAVTTGLAGGVASGLLNNPFGLIVLAVIAWFAFGRNK